MAFAVVSTSVCSGPALLRRHKLLLSSRSPMRTDFLYPKLKTFRKMSILHSPKLKGVNFSTYGSNSYPTQFKDDLEPEPFWMSMINDVVWSLRSLVTFLIDQPSQLKHIEWPSFQATLKTATLTLILVAVIIVALSSVDSALSYTLALLLRRTR